MLQQHWHKHVIFIRTGFPFFSKSNFSNMQQFLEEGAGGCSPMRSFQTFWQALLPGPSCLLPPPISAAKTLSSALHRDEGFPHLTSPLPPLHLTHHNTSLRCALPSSCQKPPALLAHLFLLLSFQILKFAWSTPKHCCDAAWLQAAPGQGTQRIAQPCLHGAARSVFQGWQPHHEYISRRAQPFILILINAWRDPDFCKYILLYVLSSQGRVFKACSK